MVAGCPITIWRPIASVRQPIRATRCNQPVVAHGLCAKHEAERVRLVGGARAIFPLDHDMHVEVGPTTTTKEHR